MQLIFIAAGLSLVSAAALPQVDTDDFQGDPGALPSPESQGLDQELGAPFGEVPTVEEVPSDPSSNLDELDSFGTTQDTTVPTIEGEFDRAEGEACVAAMIVDFPNEKAGVDCTCFCGGLSCINKMVDQQIGIDFRADPRIPVGCQAYFDSADQSQAPPEDFNEGAGSSMTSSSDIDPSALEVPPTTGELGDNPIPEGSSETGEERLSEAEEVLSQNPEFSTPEEQFFRDSIIGT